MLLKYTKQWSRLGSVVKVRDSQCMYAGFTLAKADITHWLCQESRDKVYFQKNQYF